MALHVDLGFLRRICKGDHARMAEFIRAYLTTAPRLYEDLTEAAQRGDAKALSAATHDLRPQVHYMGAHRLAELLETIDQQARLEPPVLRIDLVDLALPIGGALSVELHEVLEGSVRP
ncbi:MAG: Hpt domain-containing protein [Flavobacteriales bacterium]|nr:Hpt domain-containing protein [Flavobacteriales bacterium]